MAAQKKPGRGRMDFMIEPELADAVAEAARRDDRSVSSYVRKVLLAQMEREGIKVKVGQKK